jgi:UDP-N-acetylmuramate dehydrogenase
MVPVSWFSGLRGELRSRVPLAPFTHIKIGGHAELLVLPTCEADFVLVRRVCLDHGLPLFVLGAGSNILVPDQGLPGVVVCTHGFAGITRDQAQLSARAGTSLPALLKHVQGLGLAGLDTLVGIPATVGGAVAMNAGTRDGETFDHLHRLRVVFRHGEIADLDRGALHAVYRDGRLGDAWVLAATFALAPEPAEAIQARMDAALARRNATQPTAQKSLGCIFRNPPGDAAGRLIEAAGLKGERCGALVVSDRHANYFLNTGGGTAAELLALLDRIQRRVLDRFGVRLLPEIRFAGRPDQHVPDGVVAG